MDSASVSGTEGCGFKSHLGRSFLIVHDFKSIYLLVEAVADYKDGGFPLGVILTLEFDHRNIFIGSALLYPIFHSKQ